MVELFKTVVFMSAAGGIFALLLLCIKPWTRKYFSPKWQYYIWLTVLIVMILPIRFSVPREKDDIMNANTITSVEQSVNGQVSERIEQSYKLNELSGKVNLRINEILVVNVMCVAWIFVALIILVYKIIKYLIFVQLIRKKSVDCEKIKNIPLGLGVKKTYVISAPLIVGIIKPFLYIPDMEVTEEELEYILLHELKHYNRHDLLYKWFVMLVSIIHWFNPLIYIVSKQIDEECEISCDWEVCKHFTECEKKQYMSMILKFISISVNNKMPLITQMAGSKEIIRMRFNTIISKKTTSKAVSILSIITAVIMMSATVLASGYLNRKEKVDYTIKVKNNGEVIDFVNKPFYENGYIYLPLRETFEKTGHNESNSYIIWNSGTIDVAVSGYPGDNGLYRLRIGEQKIELRHFKGENINGTSMDDDSVITMSLSSEKYGIPVLKDSTVFVSIDMLNYMLYGFLDIRDADNSVHELSAEFYDDDGNLLERKGTYSAEILSNPNNTANGFLDMWELGSIDTMKEYCSSEFANSNESYIWNEFQTISYDRLWIVEDYSDKTSIKIPVQATVISTGSEIDFDLVLEKQANGIWLISNIEYVNLHCLPQRL